MPCIAYTAYHSSLVKKQAIEAGCNAYLTKPVDAQSLIDAINHAIQRHILSLLRGFSASALAPGRPRGRPWTILLAPARAGNEVRRCARSHARTLGAAPARD